MSRTILFSSLYSYRLNVLLFVFYQLFVVLFVAKFG